MDEERAEASAREGPPSSAAGGSADHGRTLVGNAGALIASRYAVAALGWGGTLVIVRSLSVEAFGRFSFVFGFLGLLAILTDLGIGRVVVRDLHDPGHDPARYAGAFITLRMAMGIVGYALAVSVVVLGGYPSEVVAATAVAGLGMVLSTPSDALNAVFQAHLRIGTYAVANVVAQAGQLALTAAIATAGGTVVLFALPAVLFEVVAITWKAVLVRRVQPIRLNVDFVAWRQLLRLAGPLAIGLVLTDAYYRIDTVILSKLSTFSAVGVYGVMYKFVDIVHFLPSALNVTALPLLARTWGGDGRDFRDVFRRSVSLTLITSALIAVEFALFARPIISLLYGARYADGAWAGRLVVAAECLNAFSMLAATVLLTMGRTRIYSVAALVGLLLNVGLNLWLIPDHSYNGAAAATLATAVLVVVVMWIPLLRDPRLRPLPVRAASVALLAAAGAAAAGTLAMRVLPWPAAVVVSLLAFAAVTQVGGGARAQDLVALVRGRSA